MKKEKSNYNISAFNGNIKNNNYRYNDNNYLNTGDLLDYQGYIRYNKEKNSGSYKKFYKPMTPKYINNKNRK